MKNIEVTKFYNRCLLKSMLIDFNTNELAEYFEKESDYDLFLKILVDLIYNLPAYCIAAFPTLYGNIGFWWIAYTIVGVALPLLLDLVFQTVKDCVFRKRYSNRSY